MHHLCIFMAVARCKNVMLHICPYTLAGQLLGKEKDIMVEKQAQCQKEKNLKRKMELFSNEAKQTSQQVSQNEEISCMQGIKLLYSDIIILYIYDDC